MHQKPAWDSTCQSAQSRQKVQLLQKENLRENLGFLLGVGEILADQLAQKMSSNLLSFF
jgi:hypothetical protein